MAKVYPSEYSELALDGAQARERDVLMHLKSGLPDDFMVYHGIHWTRLEHGLTVIGRVQFLVLSPRGHVYAILMRTGLLKLQEGRLIKQLGEQRQDVFNAMLEQAELLQHKFRAQHKTGFSLESIFYCPDFTVPQINGLAVEMDRVVDASRKDGLCTLIQALDRGRDQDSSLKTLHLFFCNVLDLVPEVGALSEAADSLVTRLSQGLEQWVGRLAFEPFHLRVVGTAGSGKSLLALKELGRSQQYKSRTLYVCYNRPLAAHMNQQIRAEGQIGAQSFNFHALCDRVLRDAGMEVDYGQPGVFAKLPEWVSALPLDKRWVFDSIVVDEGQDFEQDWVAVLQRMSHAKTRWIWLEDPVQNLYSKPRVNLPAWVELTVPVNYRNPRRIVEALMQLKPQFHFETPWNLALEAGCPLEGLPIEWMSYNTDETLLAATGKAITQCLKLGFARDHIAVLTLRGHEKSKVLKQGSVGPHSLRHFTGQYDEHGGQVFTQGSVVSESVYRFKGQSAQAVVITELDFEEFNELDYRKLFVAMTRATLALVIVGRDDTVRRLQGVLPSGLKSPNPGAW